MPGWGPQGVPNRKTPADPYNRPLRSAQAASPGRHSPKRGRLNWGKSPPLGNYLPRPVVQGVETHAPVNEDLQLVRRTLGGDVAAFGVLVERHEQRLLRALYFRLGCREAARDAAQEAFVLAYTKLESFQAESGFYTWLYRIAINRSISQARKRRPVRLADSGAEDSGVVSRQADLLPEDALVRSEQAAQVHLAIQQLAAEHQEVVILREMEGRSYEEIADLLQIPLGTVRSRLARAREQLKVKLSKYHLAEQEETRL